MENLLRKSLILLGSCWLFCMACQHSAVPASPLFYYTFSEKVPLFIVDNKLIVKYQTPVNQAQMDSLLKTQDAGIQTQWYSQQTVALTLPSAQRQSVWIDVLNQRSDVKTVNPLYKTQNGAELGVTDEILVQFQPTVSADQQKALHQKFGTIRADSNNVYQLLRVYKGADALQIANRYQESGLTQYAQPNFFMKLILD